MEPTRLEIEAVLTESAGYVDPVQRLFGMARDDLARMETQASAREDSMTEDEARRFQGERARLLQRLDDLEHGELGFDVAVMYLETLQDNLTESNRGETLRQATAWVGAFLQIVERLSLVPAQARLEVISVEAIDLDADAAFQIALSNRLDFMNGRAALVDRWRAIQVNADALQAFLDVTVNGDVRTAKNNPLDFRASTSRVSVGLEFDAPFTRLLERNAYRESLIEYQRSRRDFIQSQDALLLGLRALLRNLEQLRQNLEIQRRAVTIAMRRVDQTQLELTEPRPPVQPGARAAINPTTAINLLSAQGSLQSTQNAFLAAWLNYYATRMRLYRELGIMTLDPEGEWIEFPIDAAASPVPGVDAILPEDVPALPPALPPAIIDAALEMEAHETSQEGGDESHDPIWSLDSGSEVVPAGATSVAPLDSKVRGPSRPVPNASEKPRWWWQGRPESAQRAPS